jgi:aryl-alcohol dehydrogenase-like predicted oxidoreductase
MFFDRYFGDEAKAKVMCDKLKASKVIADELGCSQAQMFIAWTMKYKNMSVVLLGASRLSQLEDNLKALTVVPKLTPEVLERLEALWQTRPVQEKNFLNWQPGPNRR